MPVDTIAMSPACCPVAGAGYQLVKKCRPGIFQPRQGQSKAPPGSQNNDIRHYFGIASMRSRSLLNISTGCYAWDWRPTIWWAIWSLRFIDHNETMQVDDP